MSNECQVRLSFEHTESKFMANAGHNGFFRRCVYYLYHEILGGKSK